ncbi:MAG: helix-turn-helix domain-containing protein [Proteobacteria bacterium]|nr:helix-turn-helix domain-containing protein [Pseudomonadota bacterium]
MNKRQAQKLSDQVITSLRKQRLGKNITQYKLAKETGISKSSIYYIESLKQRPTLYTLLMIADYLEVNLSDIIKQFEDK